MAILIKNGTLVNEGLQYKADIIVEKDRISDIVTDGNTTKAISSFDAVIDADGCVIIPGVIDSHVHFREPGLTHKADMESESRAAAYGGVTTVFDMPNTEPQTTSIKALEEKKEIAREKMHVNYAFFIGATNNNADELGKIEASTIPGIKVFMGSSTGNMLVDEEKALETVFKTAEEKCLPLMSHCEDTGIINRNMRYYKEKEQTEDPEISLHPFIRSEEACYKSSALAVKLARTYGTRLHIAHVSTEKELGMLTEKDKNITFEATVAHLLFSQDDYKVLGTAIKCNPAIKTQADRDALRNALNKAGHRGIYTIGTDHAPHSITEKEGGAAKAVSGMPMIQFSLVAMLELVDKNILPIERMVELMCHNPATLFSIKERGFIRKGYKADIVILSRNDTPWVVSKNIIQSKCGWSPLEGYHFHWQIRQTMCNGNIIYSKGEFDACSKGEEVRFAHA